MGAMGTRALPVIAGVAVAGVLAACTPTPTTPPVTPTVATSVPVATVPDVVGMNHQEAQDLLQATGFHRLNEQDATGQGRLLVLDRNWEVVSQSVKAGTSVPIDTPITLSSKKIGE